MSRRLHARAAAGLSFLLLLAGVPGPAMAAAERIISLAPHVTELLHAAGAGDRLVGADEFSDWPPAARALPRVGNYARLDVERILSLRPDLVIGWEGGNDPADLERLRGLGLRVEVTRSTGLLEIADDIERLGALAGTSGEARRAAATLRGRLQALGERFGRRPPVRVFYQIWDRPLMTVGGTHFIADAIRLCGGENVFGDLVPAAPSVSVEAVLARNPEAIVNSASMDPEPQLAAWQRWREVEAVRRGSLFAIPPDLISRPGVRVADGAERLCEALELAREAGAQPRGERQ